MNAIKILTYTLVVAALLSVICFNPVLNSSSLFFAICLITGIMLVYFTWNLEESDAFTPVEMVYLPSSLLMMVVATTTEIVNIMLDKIAVLTGSASRESALLGGLKSIFQAQNIVLLLIIMSIGIVGPLLVTQALRKQKTPWLNVAFSAFIVLALLGLAFFIQQIIIGQLINVAVVKV